MILLAGIAFTLLNIRGAGVTGKTETVIVIAKIAVLAVFIVFGIVTLPLGAELLVDSAVGIAQSRPTMIIMPRSMPSASTSSAQPGT